jgi:hypothetical protein
VFRITLWLRKKNRPSPNSDTTQGGRVEVPKLTREETSEVKEIPEGIHLLNYPDIVDSKFDEVLNFRQEAGDDQNGDNTHRPEFARSSKL